MAQAIGYVTKLEDGSYKGNLRMGVNTAIEILPNEARKDGDDAPDFIVISSLFGEVGTARNKIGQVSGKPYVAVRLSHPKIDRNSIFANLGQAYGGEKCDYAMLWDPAN